MLCISTSSTFLILVYHFSEETARLVSLQICRILYFSNRYLTLCQRKCFYRCQNLYSCIIAESPAPTIHRRSPISKRRRITQCHTLCIRQIPPASPSSSSSSLSLFKKASVSVAAKRSVAPSSSGGSSSSYSRSSFVNRSRGVSVCR